MPVLKKRSFLKHFKENTYSLPKENVYVWEILLKSVALP